MHNACKSVPYFVHFLQYIKGPHFKVFQVHYSQKIVEIKEDELGRDMWVPLPRDKKRLTFPFKSRTIRCLRHKESELYSDLFGEVSLLLLAHLENLARLTTLSWQQPDKGSMDVRRAKSLLLRPLQGFQASQSDYSTH